MNYNSHPVSSLHYFFLTLPLWHYNKVGTGRKVPVSLSQHDYKVFVNDSLTQFRHLRGKVAIHKHLLKRNIIHQIPYIFNMQDSYTRNIQNLPKGKAGGNFGPNSSAASSSCFEAGNKETPGSALADTLSMKIKQNKDFFIQKKKTFLSRYAEKKLQQTF